MTTTTAGGAGSKVAYQSTIKQGETLVDVQGLEMYFPVNAGLFDLLGRRFTIGIRFKH